MKQGIFTLKSNEKIASGTFKMVLTGDCSDITVPGRFVNIALPGRYLRRPISVCDVNGDDLTLIYKVVGGGTGQMAGLAPGTELDLLTGLGNGFDLSKSGDRPLVIGGGVGLPPLYLLTKRLIAQGKRPVLLMGFNRADEVFYREEFEALCPVYLSTADGSAGVKGFVTDLLPSAGEYSYFFACGPLPMLKALMEVAVTGGQLSFEERMGCGFGACMGCSRKTVNGYKRVCKDGPVFEKEEIVW